MYTIVNKFQQVFVFCEIKGIYWSEWGMHLEALIISESENFQKMMFITKIVNTLVTEYYRQNSSLCDFCY